MPTQIPARMRLIMKGFHIQKVTLNEVEQLQQIGKQTFTETFSSDNSGDNIKEYLEERKILKDKIMLKSG